MACNCQSCNICQRTSLLPFISYFFFACNGISSTVRAYSHSDYSMVGFIIFVYLGFFLLEYCSSAYQRLPPHKSSRKKHLLKFTTWFLFSAIMIGFAHQFAQFFSLAAGLSLYAVSVLGSALLFYVCMIFDGTKDCAKSCTKEKRKFSDEKVISVKKIRHHDSISDKI